MKKFLVLFAACLAALTVACESSGANSDPVDMTTAAQVNSASYTGMIAAYSGAFDAIDNQNKAQCSFDLQNGVSGTAEWENVSGTIFITGLTINFDNYICGDATLNGTATITSSGSSEQTGTFSYDADYTATWQGVTYEVSASIETVVTGGTFSFTATYIINGNIYLFSASGVPAY